MTPEHILILGAGSDIAVETARRYAAKGCHFTLAARDNAQLQGIKTDLTARGAGDIHTVEADLAEIAAIPELFQSLITTGQKPVNLILLAYGFLGEQARAQQEPEMLEQILRVNFTSAAQWCEQSVTYFEKQKGGMLAVIGSVAGDRIRQSNYAYGTAKGALALYMNGLRHRLVKSPVHLLLIKPGMIDTKMTDDMDRSGPLWASPEQVARDIEEAIRKERDCCYTPRYWQLIMLIIRLLPNFIFKRLKL